VARPIKDQENVALSIRIKPGMKELRTDGEPTVDQLLGLWKPGEHLRRTKPGLMRTHGCATRLDCFHAS
jgi:hypothetical protein